MIANKKLGLYLKYLTKYAPFLYYFLGHPLQQKLRRSGQPDIGESERSHPAGHLLPQWPLRHCRIPIDKMSGQRGAGGIGQFRRGTNRGCPTAVVRCGRWPPGHRKDARPPRGECEQYHQDEFHTAESRLLRWTLRDRQVPGTPWSR